MMLGEREKSSPHRPPQPPVKRRRGSGIWSGLWQWGRTGTGRDHRGVHSGRLDPLRRLAENDLALSRPVERTMLPS
jgi:hypothetical protein